MHIAAIRRLPRAVLAFALLTAATTIYGLSRAPTLFHKPVAAAVVVVLLILWPAAIVVWQKRWAWVLYVLTVCINVASPIWQGVELLPYIVSVVMLGLLVSPGMRGYVGVKWQRHRDASM